MSIYKAGSYYVAQIGNIIVLASNRLEAMHAAAATVLKEKDDMGSGLAESART